MKKGRSSILLGLMLLAIAACDGTSSISGTNSVEAPASPISKTTPSFTPTPTIMPSPAPTPFGGGTGKVAFIAGGLYMANVDGGDLTKLADGQTTFCFAWSPDGQKIVFQGFDFDIYMLNTADKSEPKRIMDVTPMYGQGLVSCPVWSPDGDKLIITTASGVYIVDVNGRLKAWGDGWGHAWSPDGQRIAYTTSYNDEAEIGIMNADGSGKAVLTDSAAGNSFPAWSPDGRTIAFVSDREVKGVRKIYLMNADGSQQRKLTQIPGGAPIWSPDGRYIAYASVYAANNQWTPKTDRIYVVNADGTGQKPLMQIFGSNPVWSPDSQHLVFNHDGKIAYTIDADRSHLTRFPILSYSLAWQPSPRAKQGIDTTPAPAPLLTPLSISEPTPTNTPLASSTPVPISPSLEAFVTFDNHDNPIVLSLAGYNPSDNPQVLLPSDDKSPTELPPEIWKLTTLQQLDLAGIRLRQLPPGIGQLTALQELDLSNAELSRLPPEIGQLENLWWLDLSSNPQLDQLPPEIGQLTKLRYLDLPSTELSRLPPEIGQLKNLQHLDLSYTPLSQPLSEIEQLTNLNCEGSSGGALVCQGARP